MIALESGLQIKHYTLESLIGIGATGEVWKAHFAERTVAIKFMNESLLNSADFDKHRHRFKTEINSLLRLKKGYVPAVYDFDFDFVRPYVVMKYIDGDSYDRLLAQKEMLKIPLAQRFKAIGLIALTLTHAHHRGIIHRDIKPANIKGIDPPYLLDFGIALESQHLDTAKPEVGTGIYMPPWGEPLDKRSDMYSFALVVYEMLFGQHPLFTPATIGKTVMETRQRAGEYLRTNAWRMPSRIAPHELPVDLRDVDLTLLDTLFAKAWGDPAQRYAIFALFLADLKVALTSKRAFPLEIIDEFPEDSESFFPPLAISNLEDEAYLLTQPTNYPVVEDEHHIPRRWILIGVGMIILLSLIVLILLTTQ